MIIANTFTSSIPTEKFKAVACTQSEFTEQLINLIGNIPDLYDLHQTESVSADLSETTIGTIIRDIVWNLFDNIDTNTDQYRNYIDTSALSTAHIMYGDTADIFNSFQYNNRYNLTCPYQFCKIDSTTVLMGLSCNPDDKACMTVVYAYFTPENKLAFYVPVFGNTVFADNHQAFSNIIRLTADDFSETFRSAIDTIKLPEYYGSISIKNLSNHQFDSLLMQGVYALLYGIEKYDINNPKWLQTNHPEGWIADAVVDLNRTFADISCNIQIIKRS